MVWTNTHRNTQRQSKYHDILRVSRVFSRQKTRSTQPFVIDAVIITVEADLSVISVEQRGKPDQATHAVLKGQNHSKKKKDLIQFQMGQKKLQISTLSLISNAPQTP